MGCTASTQAVNPSSSCARHPNALIVDAGSGHASLFYYSWLDGRPQQVARQGLRLPDGTAVRLDCLMSAGDTSVFVDSLDCAVQQIEAEGAAYLVVGATGGVRACLLEGGSIAGSAFTELEHSLQERFEGRAGQVQLRCISGADEGKWELAAVQSIWGADTERMFGRELGGFVGLLSGGGSSMQIAASAGAAAVSYNFSTIWDPMDETKAADKAAWRQGAIWSQWEHSLLDSIRGAWAADAPEIEGCFVGTAMNFQAAEAAGIADKTITAAEAIETLREALAEFKDQAGRHWEREKDKPRKARYNWFRVISLHLCRLAHVLEKMFAPSTILYFTRRGLNDHTASLDCEWTLGMYLNELV